MFLQSQQHTEGDDEAGDRQEQCCLGNLWYRTGQEEEWAG